MRNLATRKEVIANYPDRKSIINAVINRIGLKSVNDVITAPNGAASGFPGFTSYSDTHKFAIRHRKAIISMLEETAEAIGGEEDVVKMVASFGVSRKSPMDKDDKKELYKYLGGCKCDQSVITNVMAWFALEEVCRMFEQ